MSRFIMLYALLSYGLFLTVCVWMAAFLLDIEGTRTSPAGMPWPMAAAVDIALISVFLGFAHSIMARPAFKRA